MHYASSSGSSSPYDPKGSLSGRFREATTDNAEHNSFAAPEIELALKGDLQVIAYDDRDA